MIIVKHCAVRLLTINDISAFVSSDHGLLPNAAMIEGRLLVAAWEAGLENVQSDLYTLLSLATEVRTFIHPRSYLQNVEYKMYTKERRLCNYCGYMYL